MGSTSVSWEVTSLEVQTTTPSATSDGLYANGNMQVPVVVVIKTIDPDTNTSYQLSESDLETIKLIDYDDPPTELSGSWSYSTTENEFDHSLPSSKKALQPDLSLTDGGSQKKRYWVTTTKVENKRVAASIKQPNGTVVHTAGDPYDSKATLTGTDVVTYKLDDINLRKGDTTSGTGETVASQKWSSTNYYLTTNKYPLRKADVNGDNLRTDQGVENSYLENAMACFFSASNEFDIFYYWPMGPEETRRVGGASGAPIEITVNEESNALCFTHMHLQNYDFGWTFGFLFYYRFIFYDQFGNPGTFWVGYNDSHTTLEILDHKYTADDYGHDA
ncbi:calcineurin-like phosphoesterase [Aspergillus niger]|uniref:uncharacterized protein n=1 Tax=Aspergillus lacticoffeatus (strain CBS 101883) TaxID=1450533 RepID=UPI000D7F1E2B|nr:uncharacterized protein BO96DRAFT_115429 [Aspergillus niger CBS 101883]PYH54035.1 hypothetical protein BO96DRAFT_115429 [Aspergillus niger CBS 101883]GJP93899.1 calcineurin-like phosphoesterase [Aspergillus niger]